MIMPSRSRQLAVLVFTTMALSWALVAPSTAASDHELEQRVRDLIEYDYFHGMPFQAARKLGPRAVPILEKVLDDPGKRRQWVNAAAAIGMIGSSKSFPILRRFVWQRVRGPVDDRSIRALLAAQEAIGWIDPKVDPRAEEYLWLCANPAYWDSLPWWEKNNVKSQGLWLALSQLSINGLGWSGSKKSLNRLETLAAKPYDPRQSANIATARKRVRKIQEMGRAKYLESLASERQSRDWYRPAK